jgi:hypothetical protein
MTLPSEYRKLAAKDAKKKYADKRKEELCYFLSESRCGN